MLLDVIYIELRLWLDMTTFSVYLSGLSRHFHIHSFHLVVGPSSLLLDTNISDVTLVLVPCVQCGEFRQNYNTRKSQV